MVKYMKLEVFVENICKEIEVKMGPSIKVESNVVSKNNGVCLHGITIVPKGETVYPNLYIDDLYEEYKDQEMVDYSQVADRFIACYNNYKLDIPIAKDFFEEFDSIKSQIMCKLVNYERNTSYLEGRPYLRFHDLAIIFYYLFKDDQLEHASIFLQNEHFEKWNITISQLYEAALENTMREFPPYIETMEEKIRHIIEHKNKNCVEEDLDESYGEKIDFMYVLCNPADLNGAVGMLDFATLERFAKRINSSFYILPSSVHEVILVPAHTPEDKLRFLELVQEANEECVLPEDFLSNSVYYYDMDLSDILCFSAER